VPKIFEPHRVDRVIDVSEDGAIQAARDLASNEGLFVGPSSGGAFLAALTVAREIQSGVVVFVCCDRGDRYLSANIFGGEEGDTDHHHPKAKM
jgi:cysteine synthase B